MKRALHRLIGLGANPR